MGLAKAKMSIKTIYVMEKVKKDDLTKNKKV